MTQILDIVLHKPGKTYTNEEMLSALSERDETLSQAIVKLGGKHFKDEALSSPTFFENLGVEERNIFCDPADPELWWGEHAGKDPFALEAAKAYELLMGKHEPLTQEDRLIVIGNGVDTTAPHIGYAVLGHLRERNEGFVEPTVLSLVGEGCSGFISGLREASLYMKAKPGSRVVVITVEMMATPLLNPWVQPGLLKQAGGALSEAERRSLRGRLTGLGIQRYLFGEGCSAALCINEGQEGLRLDRFGKWANLKPEDRHLLELTSTNTKAGPHLPPFGFFQQNPKLLFERLVTSYLPEAYGELSSLGRRPEHFAVHTGSGKILDFVQQGFSLSDEEIQPSREVLRTCGNMNATTGAAILKSLLEAGAKDVFAMFFGVGFALQTACKEA